MQDLKVIIDHFDKYPLLSKKLADYLLFKQAFKLVLLKEHLTEEGVLKIVALKASINLGLSDKLKVLFPDIIPVQRPVVEVKPISNPQWLAGFVTGEGCYLVGVVKGKSTKSGYQAILVFSISQHLRDSDLMKNIVKYLGCGNFRPRHKKSYGEISVQKFSDIVTKIIPLFDEYPIRGDKAQDFASFKRVAIIVQNKEHLTIEGLDEIRKIKTGMNLSRYSKSKKVFIEQEENGEDE